MIDLIENIKEKKAEQSMLLCQLEKRVSLIAFLRTHDIHVDEDARFTCGVVGCYNKVIAVKVNGVEHPIDTTITVNEYFDRYVP